MWDRVLGPRDLLDPRDAHDPRDPFQSLGPTRIPQDPKNFPGTTPEPPVFLGM